MYWWSDFDAAEVREEFSVIKELGLTLVRIFLLWEDWQPAPTRISQIALGHLEQVCNIAADLGLLLDVTFFTGHMSGPSWAPSWMLRQGLPMPPGVRQVVSGQRPVNCGYANPFTDPIVLRATELLARTVVSRLKNHPAIYLWNLGNEPDLFAKPPSAESGCAWVQRMTALLHEIDPTHPVTCGLHVPSLIEDNGLRVNDIFSKVDVPVMHGYPMYADWSSGPLDPDFVPFLCALTFALCGKPTLMEEFGGCTEAPGKPSSVWRWTSYGKPHAQFMASEEEFAAYIEQVLPRLVEVGALGAMLWCYADYAPELYDRPPCDEAWHERFFGLVRPDGSLKPHATAIKRFAATEPTVQPARRRVALEISSEAYYQDPLTHAKQLYRAFLE
jgi:endo-1,4-beta-mannosidase